MWDTALTLPCAARGRRAKRRCAPAKQGLDWLKPLQVLDVKGDWAVKRPDVRPGGWAFQYTNAHYPDLDDTAVVVMAMDRAPARQPTSPEYDVAIDARPRMDRGHAEPQRRLGRVRRRQPRILPQQHPVLRPRRAARSADRGRHRALRLDAGAARRDRANQQGASRTASTICAGPSSRRESGTAAGA